MPVAERDSKSMHAVRHRLWLRVHDLNLEYIPNPAFQYVRAAREADITGPKPPAPPQRAAKPTPGLPAYLRTMYDTPLLTRDQEAHLFRKYNYLKYKASRIRDNLGKPASIRELRAILLLASQAEEVRNEIITANLRMAVNVARKNRHRQDDLFDLISDANITIMKAVEKFDYGRNFRFSTYAMWSLIKNFCRTVPAEIRHRDRFRTGESAPDLVEDDYFVDVHKAEQDRANREAVKKLLGCLDARERHIICLRFGLGNDPMTLKEAGAVIGVTKERIRQLERWAKDKMAFMARVEGITPPAALDE